MNTHKNARLTYIRRREMAEFVQSGQSQAAAAERFGVSKRTVSKWMKRFREEGVEGLADRSSRPHRSPTAVTQEQAELMLGLRQFGYVGQEIAKAVNRCATTVSKVLRSARLSTQRELDRDPSPQRYEHKAPGDLLHLDIKKLGKFRQPGHRVTGRKPGVHQRNSGWEHAHVAIDDHSRVAYVEVIDQGEKGDATAAFLERAVRHFEALGVRIKRVLTDNGSGYRSRAFRKMASRLGVKLSRTKPYTPKTNGKAERFIQTLQREWAYIRPYPSSTARRRALPNWLRRYNERRPHGSLGNAPPITRLEAAR